MSCYTFSNNFVKIKFTFFRLTCSLCLRFQLHTDSTSKSVPDLQFLIIFRFPETFLPTRFPRINPSPSMKSFSRIISYYLYFFFPFPQKFPRINKMFFFSSKFQKCGRFLEHQLSLSLSLDTSLGFSR